MLRDSAPAGQAVLVGTVNDAMEGTRWRLVERAK